MGISRIYPNKDTTIVNSFKDDLSTRSVKSNTGQSDILEIYSIYSRVSAESLEKSRILIEFDLSDFPNSLPAGTKYYLRLFNAKHSESLPRRFEISVKPISSEWEEGSGLDLIGYSDEDASSWLARKSNRVSQVLTIKLNSEDELDYAQKVITLFDGQDEQYNFYFKVVAEESSEIDVGTDVEVDISGLEPGETVTDKLEEVLQAQNFFTVSENAGTIEVTNVIPGTARAPVVSAFEEAAEQPEVLITVSGNDYVPWVTPGGDYTPLLDAQQQEVAFEQLLEEGTEDITLDITDIVASWLSVEQGSLTNYGLGIMLKGEFEDGSKAESYYTKRFHARDSEYFFKRPCIEARYSLNIEDDSSKLFTASPHKSAAANTMKVYYRNYENGDLVDLASDPKFTLTTDKALADKVTLLPGNPSNSILDSPSSDYTENAYVQIKVNNTSAATGFGWSNSLIIITHVDQDSNEETQFSFVSRYPYWSAPDARNDVYPVSVANTLENRIAAAQAIAKELNEYPGFSALFVAESTGESVKIYTKVQGNAGQLNTISIFTGSNTPSDFLIFEQTPAHAAANFDPFVADADPVQEGDQPSGNEYDSITLLNDAAWTQLRNDSSITDLLSANLALDDRALTYNRSTRALRGNSGVVAEAIDSDKVAGTVGTYVAEFKIANNIAVDTLYKKWWIGEDESNLLRGHDGSMPVSVKNWYDEGLYSKGKRCTLAIENLQNVYSIKDTVEFRVKAFEIGAAPNVVSKNVGKNSSSSVLTNLHFRLFRISDNLEIISYDLDDNSTLLAYDDSCNFFNFDMSILESGYLYGLQFMSLSGQLRTQYNQIFKFKVE